MENREGLYREGRATLWRAAKTADLTLGEMMELAAKEGIEFKYGRKELDIEAALKG